jgi:hypothetical protein
VKYGNSAERSGAVLLKLLRSLQRCVSAGKSLIHPSVVWVVYYNRQPTQYWILRQQYYFLFCLWGYW